MCARGILQNPAMFAGHDNTPLQCVQDWVGTLCKPLFNKATYLLSK